jgi:type IV pilus assembly protein PilY1
MRAVTTIRKAVWLAGTAALVAVSGNSVAAPLLLQDVPLFISTGAEPNVMIMLDNSGSMGNIVPDAPFDAATVYLPTCPAANTVSTGTQVNLALSGTSPRIQLGGTNYIWGTASGRRCFAPTAAYLALLNTNASGSLPAQYTGNYLNWYFDTARDPLGCATGWAAGKKPCTQTRLEIAKVAGVNLVASMPTAMRTGLST